MLKESYMKKIYILSQTLAHGGIEKVVCNLANLFVEMNYDVEIVCTYYLGEPVYYLDNKVKIIYLADGLTKKSISLKKSLKNFSLRGFLSDVYARYNYPYTHKVVKKYVKGIKNSIIISTRHENNILISKYAKRSNKLIAQLHCDHTQFEGYSKDIKSKYKNIDYLLLLNEELKSEIEPELTECNNKTKCLVVPNFIVNQKNINDIERKKQVISIGRLVSGKGFDRLLLIWKKFIINNEGYVLKIAGDGPEKTKLIKLAQSLDISDSVIFTGFISNDETVKEIRQSKLLVMTSLHEALPMVLLESISQGTPIVAYDVRVGPRSIIEEGYNGFLIKDNDVDAFVEKLQLLLQENNMYNNMSKNCITSSKLYSKENLKDVWFEIIN